MQLTAEGQPCSLQEARARILQDFADRERQYRLYAYLTRLGYHPVRHGDTHSGCTGEVLGVTCQRQDHVLPGAKRRRPLGLYRYGVIGSHVRGGTIYRPVRNGHTHSQVYW